MRSGFSLSVSADAEIKKHSQFVQVIHYFSQISAEAYFRRELQDNLGYRAQRSGRVLPDATCGGIRKNPNRQPKHKRARLITPEERAEQVLLSSIEHAFATSSDPRQFDLLCSRLQGPSDSASLVRAALTNSVQQSGGAEAQTKSYKRSRPLTAAEKASLAQVREVQPVHQEESAQSKRSRPMTAGEKVEEEDLCLSPGTINSVQRALDVGRPIFIRQIEKLKRDLIAEQTAKAQAIAGGQGKIRSPALQATPDSVMEITAHLDSRARGGASATGSTHFRRLVGFSYATPRISQKGMKQSSKAFSV